jgi:hypothetical protein
MKAITLRNIPPEVQRAITEKVQQKGISANRAVIELLQERVGVPRKKEKVLHHDLDHLFGTMSAEEADELQRFVMEQRELDKQFFGK